MAYSIRFKKRARIEFDDCCHIYGEGLRTDLWNWLNQIAESADNGSGFDSIDLIELLDEGLQQQPSAWRFALHRWWKSTPVEKIRAFIVVLKKYCPPWELQTTTTWLQLLGRIDCEVQAVFLVDRVKRQVTFVKFEGLPGQP